MRPARLSSRLSLSVAMMGMVLALFLSALAYLSLVQQLDRIAEQTLEEKLGQIRHGIADMGIRPELGDQAHNIRDLVRGHDNMSLTLYGPAPQFQQLLTVGNLSGNPPLDIRDASASMRLERWRSAEGKSFLTAYQLIQRSDGSQIRALLSLDRSADQALLGAYIESTLIALPLVLILIATGAWWIAQRGLSSLNQFRRVASLVSTQDLSHRISLNNLPLELKELANGINYMLHRLDSGVQQLSKFSDDLAHELRSPITNLIGKAQVTLSRERPPEEYKAVLENCTEELGRVTRIVSDMLFLAHVSHPAELTPFERVSLHEEAEKVADLFSLNAEEKDIRLRISGQATVSGDRLMIQRAISNLLSNAIRHTPAHSTIEIEISADSNNVTLAVSNPGAGIAAEHLPKLFERFYRVDRGRSRADGGTGLGLAIVRSIMGLHQGKVEVDSTIGGITIFRLCFQDTQPTPPTGKQ